MKPIIGKHGLIIMGITLQSAVIVWLVYLQLHQKQLGQRIDPFDPQVIEQMSQTQEDLTTRTAAIEQRQHDQGTEQQLAEMLLLQEETSQQLKQLQGLRTESDELRALISARLESLELDVARLKEQQAKAVQQPAIAKPAATPKRTTAWPPSLPVLPFTLISIEKRAGESFASVAPNNAARLDQVRLLKSGESLENWRLVRIEPAGKAVFFGFGQQHVVSSLQE